MGDFPIPALVRLRAQPERGVGVTLVRAGDDCYLWFEGKRKKFRIQGDAWESLARDQVVDHAVLAFLDGDISALEGVKPELHEAIRSYWYIGSLYAGAKFDASKSRAGLENQKELSAMLGSHGIREPDPRWKRVIGRGRDLYALQP